MTNLRALSVPLRAAAAAARIVSLATLLALTLAPAAFAQEDANVERGFAAEKVYAFGEVDSVNLFNGNLVLTIPIGGGYPVNGGLGYGLKLIYNSNIWDFQTRLEPVWENGKVVSYDSFTQSRVSTAFNAGVGWTLSMGRMFAPNHPDNPSAYGAYTFVGEDGGTHELYPTLHEGETATSTVLYSRDGSYQRLKLSSPSGGQYLTADVESPDGTVRRFTRASADWSSPYRLVSIKDAFTNTVSVTYPSATRWTISDGHRTHHVDFAARTVDSQTVQYVSSVTLASFGGTSATYTFAYTDLQFDRHSEDTDPTTGATTTAPVLSSVALPDGSFWRMPLHHTTAAAGPGLIQRLELPTLGKIDWTWRTYQYPQRSDGVGGETLSVANNYGVATKRVLTASGACQTLDGVGCQWTYTPQNNFGSAVTKRTVTAPTGNETVHHFSTPFNVNYTSWTGWEYGMPFTTAVSDGQGRLLSQEVYAGTAASGVKRRSIYVRYEHDKIKQASGSTYIQDWYNTNRRVASEKTVYHDDLISDVARFTEATHSQFDGLGHYRRSLTSGNFDSGNARTTHTAFNPASGIYEISPTTNQPTAAHTYVPWSSASPWVLGTFPETWQSEGTATARQQYCFEAATGFLQRKRVLSGASAAATDLLTLYTRDAAGNLIREQHYGGDVQALGTGALCSLSLPGDQYRVDHTYSRGSRATSRWMHGNGAALPFYSLQLTVDANTGLPASAWDVSGIRSDYEYDGMGRLTWDKPTAGHGAWSEYAYVNASGTARARVDVRQRANGSKSGTILARSQFLFDFMGRLATESQHDSASTWRSKNTTWNSMGWKRSVTELGSSAATIFKNYDPFGRPQTITPPTGTTHDVTLGYIGVRQVNRTTRYNAANQLSTTTERYDRQGRLYQVIEPSGASGANTTTSYSYDVGGRLSAVFMAGGGQSQGRDFTYDQRGLLLRERHPEKGTSGNGYVRYLSYDALGNPGRKIDSVDSPTATAGAEVDLTFTYDRASRLTHQYAKGVLFKTFEYGTANGTGDWRLGRMWRASRSNYVWIGPNPYTVKIEETYTRGGPAGAVTARATQAYLDGNPIEGFTQGWAYDQLGNVSTLTYPRCTSSGCNGASTTSRTVSFTRTNGWLTSVPNYASAIGYHPNGMVSTVSHTNGVTYTQAADPSGMRRPGSYTVTNNATSAAMWQSGAYAYDGSGNVTAIGGATNSYDAVSRLVSGSVYDKAVSGGSYLGQSATYDPFGNMTSLSTQSPTTGWSMLNLPTSSASNRLDGHPYDNSGAMTSWNGNVYNREDLGLVWRVDAAGISYVHMYNADDERVWTYQDAQGLGRWTIRDLDNKVLREFKNSGGSWSVQRDYVHRDGALLAAVLYNGQVNHLHPDHLGTPRLITANYGSGPQQVAFHAYYPYGVEATYFGQDDERLKFTGHERDFGVSWSAADDLDYMHARYYNAQVARFLSVDPIGGAPSQPQSWNRLSYAIGNPLRYVDPTGTTAIDSCTVDDEGEMECTGEIDAGNNDDPGDDSSNDRGVPDSAILRRFLNGPSVNRAQPDPELLKLNLYERVVSSLDIDGVEYGRCVRENRLDYWQLIAGSAVPKRIVPPFRVPNPRQPLTTPASVAAHGVNRAFPQSAGARNVARGLRGGGRVVSKIATPLTIIEGFYDIGVLGYCGFVD
jgi:RHS repeat-associated protein